ncbi:hypothetical protein NL676_011459 [Syzygium grande]|nr:hypothetical protein NL676_011459 [Syzygium grande]
MRSPGRIEAQDGSKPALLSEEREEQWRGSLRVTRENPSELRQRKKITTGEPPSLIRALSGCVPVRTGSLRRERCALLDFGRTR